MKKRDLISLQDLTRKEINEILTSATEFKYDPTVGMELLKGKSIGLIFQKPSNRTRVSFEVGIFQMSGKCIYLGPGEINLGVRETTYDVAKTLSRYLSGIVARTFTHQDVLDLAKYATVPVINGLSDLCHPCQGLTDLFSIKQKFQKLEGLTLAYIGDGNNVCHSLMFGASKVGMNMNIAAPKGYEPNSDVLAQAQANAAETNCQINVMTSPQDAVRGAHVIYSDTFVSMGQEEETAKRLKDFKDYQVNEALVELADKNYIFMHCLPAHRGQEVTESVIDGEHSIIFDQAENRLHTQKAVLKFLFPNW